MYTKKEALDELKNLYFEAPTQVEFYDFENEYYIGGIAYQNYIICGCCGARILLDEMYDEACDYAGYEDYDFSKALEKGIVHILPEWVSIEEYIR